jgi:hypothetical protein
MRVLYGAFVSQLRGKSQGWVFQGSPWGSIARWKVVPRNPRVSEQQSTRNAVEFCSRSWSYSCSQDARDSWNAYATPPMTGFNAYMQYNIPRVRLGLALVCFAPPPGTVELCTFTLNTFAGEDTGTVIVSSPGTSFGIVINWGDGTEETFFGTNFHIRSHVYSTFEIFDVSVFVFDVPRNYTLSSAGSALATFVSFISQYMLGVIFESARLDSIAVNNVLAQCVAQAQLNGECDLDGQTPPAPPTGQGIIDAATLVARGWSVTTD